MKRFIIRLAESKLFKIAMLLAALMSGLDDLIELWFGIHNIFGLDAAHGVVITALTGVLDPLAKLLEETEKPIERTARGGESAG